MAATSKAVSHIRRDREVARSLAGTDRGSRCEKLQLGTLRHQQDRVSQHPRQDVEILAADLYGAIFKSIRRRRYNIAMGRRRDLTSGEASILTIIQQGYGFQNTIDEVFFSDSDEASIFVKSPD